MKRPANWIQYRKDSPTQIGVLRRYLWGIFLADQHQRCREIVGGIQNLDKRCWLIRVSMEREGEDLTTQSWYAEGLKRFEGLDWAMEIDRFHLNNPALQQRLNEVASTLS